MSAKRAINRGLFRVGVFAGAVSWLCGCTVSTNVAMAPPRRPTPTTAAGRACWHACVDRASRCGSRCDTSMKVVDPTAAFFDYYRRQDAAQDCLDRCALQRDHCLKTCD